MGVGNIKEFWHPGSDFEANTLIKKLGMDAMIFTGNAYQVIPKWMLERSGR
jgi:hypothetical protein